MTAPHVASTQGRRQWRFTILAAVAGALVAAVVVCSRRPSSPVGYWYSAAGQDRYLAAYTAAFADMPEPAGTIDVRTDFGIVRVYRFRDRWRY